VALWEKKTEKTIRTSNFVKREKALSYESSRISAAWGIEVESRVAEVVEDEEEEVVVEVEEDAVGESVES